MSKNKNQTSGRVVKLAAETLRNPNSSKIARQLAGSAMAQFATTKQTGKSMETVASKALSSSKYSEKTKSLAGAVLSESNKKR